MHIKDIPSHPPVKPYSHYFCGHVIFKTSDKTKKSTSHGPKILVRNVPFEATVKEVEEVFASFGQLKSVRLPKKVTGATTQIIDLDAFEDDANCESSKKV